MMSNTKTNVSQPSLIQQMQTTLIDSAKKVHVSQLKMPAILHAGSAEDQSEKIPAKSK